MRKARQDRGLPGSFKTLSTVKTASKNSGMKRTKQGILLAWKLRSKGGFVSLSRLSDGQIELRSYSRRKSCRVVLSPNELSQAWDGFLIDQEGRRLVPNKISLSDFLRVFNGQDCSIHLRAFGPKGCDPDKPEFKPVKTTAQLGELASLKNELLKIYRTRGLYFVVNGGGDRDNDITRFTAAFVESDTRPISEQHEVLDESPVPTSIRVQTLKSVHAYWLLKTGCTEVQWRQIQAGLLAYFGGDPKIKNPSRVMRLPYFNHVSLNGDGTLHYKRVELVQFEPLRRYSAEELLGIFPVSNSESESDGEAGVVHTIGSYQTWDELNSELRRRIASHKTAKKRPESWIHCKGICHQGKSDSAIALNPATGAVVCQAGCEHSAILLAFDLPEKPELSRDPEGNVSINEEREVETIPWPELPPEALYGLAGDIVETIETETKASPAALLIQLLVGMGNLMGRGPFIVADSTRHGVNPFTALVGKTAKARKGTS